MDGDWDRIAAPIWTCGLLLCAPLVLYVFVRVLTLISFKPRR